MNDSQTEELRLLRQQLADAKEKARLFEEQYRRARLKLIEIEKIVFPYAEDSSPKLNTGTGKDFTSELMETEKT